MSNENNRNLKIIKEELSEIKMLIHQGDQSFSIKLEQFANNRLNELFELSVKNENHRLVKEIIIFLEDIIATMSSVNNNIIENLSHLGKCKHAALSYQKELKDENSN